jgi:hypothetical protein
MSRKRGSLFAGAPGSTADQAPATQPPPSPPPLPATDAPPARQAQVKTGRPPSRQGKRIVSFYVEPEAVMQLNIMAIKEGSSVQALMVEALNDLFAKRGANRIA